MGTFLDKFDVNLHTSQMMQEVLKTPSALAWIAESDWNFAKSRCMPLQSRLQRTNARKAFTI